MTAEAPSTALVVATLFLGLLAALFWPLTRYVITVAHEGSHAIFGSATGGKVSAIKLHPSGDGETSVGGNDVFTGLMGYVGPPLFGILGATMLANGVSPDVVLWVSFALVVLILFQIRNMFGWFAVVVLGCVLFLVGRYGTATGRAVFAYTWVWFLLLGGFVQNALHNVGPNWSGDANNLRKWAKLPRGFWGLLFWLVTLAGMIYGGGILLGAIDPLLSRA
jgi:Peptidase M50B-like